MRGTLRIRALLSRHRQNRRQLLEHQARPPNDVAGSAWRFNHSFLFLFAAGDVMTRAVHCVRDVSQRTTMQNIFRSANVNKNRGILLRTGAGSRGRVLCELTSGSFGRPRVFNAPDTAPIVT